MKKDIDLMMSIIQQFCEEREWDQFHNPKDLAIGISTEANELLEIFRFKSEADVLSIMDNNKKKVEIEDELADILFFLFRFAQMNNIDLYNALSNKIEKSRVKYPVNQCKGSNLKYTEL